jgi:hypothetical protein
MNAYSVGQARRFLVLALHASHFLLLPVAALADPIHMHCATEAWSKTLNNPAFQISMDGNPSIQFKNLNITASPPLKPNCVYETSDITQIDVTLTFPGNSFTASQATGSSAAHVEDATANPNGPFTFNSGAATSITFNAHSNSASNVLHVSLPGGAVNFTLAGVNPLRDITNVKLDFSGTHYYLPEPSTLILAVMAGAITLLWPHQK